MLQHVARLREGRAGAAFIKNIAKFSTIFVNRNTAIGSERAICPFLHTDAFGCLLIGQTTHHQHATNPYDEFVCEFQSCFTNPSQISGEIDLRFGHRNEEIGCLGANFGDLRPILRETLLRRLAIRPANHTEKRQFALSNRCSQHRRLRSTPASKSRLWIAQ